MRSHRSFVPALLLILPLAGLLAGCTSEKIVYRDREPFNEPIEAAKGFLGYYSQETKKTTCGNCHVGHQQEWKGTAHADAYASLPSTAAETCKSCHTVTDKGNAVTGLAGWDATKDIAYADVQCESCHGPGLEHVKNPEVPANVPWARGHIADPTASCASCHEGTHHPYVEQWELSRHAEVLASPAGRAECVSCHEGKAAMKLISGRDPNYVERDQPGQIPITCTVCHDPHSNDNVGQLRKSASTNVPELNLCMTCHMRKTEASGGSSRGNTPHAPQGAVVVGTAGYRPQGFTSPEAQIISTHGSEANPRLCAGCHVNKTTVTDAAGGFVFQAVGHTFGALPCVDAQGKPTGNTGCAYTSTARSYVGCTTSGCHTGGATVVASAIASLRNQVALFADQIWVDTDGDNTIDAAPIDAGYLPMIKRDIPSTDPRALNPSDNTISPADGAEFNVRIFGEGRYANGDKSLGVHNPFLVKALLAATVNELRSYYSLPAPPAAVQAAATAAIQDLQRRQPALVPASARH